MDEPAIWEKWLSNLEMDMEEELKVENRVQPEVCETASDLTTVATTFGYSSPPCFDIDNNITNNLSLELQNASNNLEKPLLSSYYNNNNNNNSSIMSYVLSFENPTTTVPNFVPNKMCHYEEESKKKIPEEFPENRKLMKKCRNASQTQEHIIAERKRRGNITRMFIALSAIIPGLKKMDKATILNNTIDHVKYLQKRVQDLEEQNKQRKIIKSIACFKENNNNDEFNNVVTAAVSDDLSVSNGKEERPKNKTFPNVEARVLAEDVLIRVMCYKQKGILNKLMAKIGAHNLSVVCSNVLPFGNSALSITIIAQVRHELNLSMEELVKSLNGDLLKCCSSQHREF